MYIISLVFLEKSSEVRSLRGVLIFLALFLLVLSEADSYRLEASRKKEQIICIEKKVEKRLLRVFREKSGEGKSLRGVLIFLVLFLLVLSEADSYRLETSRKKEQIDTIERKSRSDASRLNFRRIRTSRHGIFRANRAGHSGLLRNEPGCKRAKTALASQKILIHDIAVVEACRPEGEATGVPEFFSFA
jgi:hypothetical protein